MAHPNPLACKHTYTHPLTHTHTSARRGESRGFYALTPMAYQLLTCKPSRPAAVDLIVAGTKVCERLSKGYMMSLDCRWRLCQEVCGWVYVGARVCV